MLTSGSLLVPVLGLTGVLTKMPKLQRIQTADRVLNMIQDNISNILDPYSSKEILQGQFLTGVQLVSGTNTVSHKLARQLIGWFVVRQRASAIIYDNQDAQTRPNLFLTLVASADVTVDLYVF
jgi:hypothetical protein